MQEVWKVYKETKHGNRYCKGKRVYEVSNLGRVKVNDEIVECKLCKEGYLLGCGIGLIHRAVAELFIPNPDNKPCIDHINTIRIDNRVENLRWVTHKENNNNPLTRKRKSEAAKGENNSMYGKPSAIRGKHKIYRDNGTYYYE